MKQVSVLIAVPSPLLTAGLAAMLSQIKKYAVSVTIIEHDNTEEILATAIRLTPSLIVADPLVIYPSLIYKIRESVNHKITFVAVSSTPLPPSVSAQYNFTLGLFDSFDKVTHIVESSVNKHDDADEDGVKDLSPREKEIVIGIVKGLSNKEIASEINVSVNTVMTHRRNISRKLQIHSSAALTIYAIVSKLVKLEDIKPLMRAK